MGLATGLLLLNLLGLARAAVQDGGPPVMRKQHAAHHHHAAAAPHQRHTQVHLGPTGEIEEATHRRQVSAVSTAGSHKAGHRAKQNPQALTCEPDFVLGIEDTMHCADAEHHEIVRTADECELARVQAGATKGDNSTHLTWILGWDDQEHFPMGCFQHPNLTQAFFFNPVGWDPKHPKGWPVCKRQKYRDGELNQNDGCPEEYTKVLDMDECQESVPTCMSACHSVNDFVYGVPATSVHDERPAGSEKYHDFPAGCFVLNQCVHYNNGTGTGPPGPDISGMPICKVAQPYHVGGTAAAA